MEDPTAEEIKTLIDRLIEALTKVANAQEHPGMNVLTAIVMQEFGKQQALVWEEHQLKIGVDPETVQITTANLRKAVESYIVVVDLDDER